MIRRRVLIIESDRRTVDELQERFERHGLEAEVALSASVGIDILAERRMDAAVVESMRP
jgi:DNA-binding response OmpR family regulator